MRPDFPRAYDFKSAKIFRNVGVAGSNRFPRIKDKPAVSRRGMVHRVVKQFVSFFHHFYDFVPILHFGDINTPTLFNVGEVLRYVPTGFNSGFKRHRSDIVVSKRVCALRSVSPCRYDRPIISAFVLQVAVPAAP